MHPTFLTRPGAPRLACLAQHGSTPTLVFFPGFNSDMQGAKAEHLAAGCAARGQACLRFDYAGHGQSDGQFTDGTIGAWTEDALAVIDSTTGPLLLVGSSMGGWIALLAALARPHRAAALLAIAPAPDFTQTLMWDAMAPAEREALIADGMLTTPNEYGPPLQITRDLILEGRNHLLLHAPIHLDIPVRILHGQQDNDVPWEHSLKLAHRITGNDVQITFLKDAGHRLSRPQDLAVLDRLLASLLPSQNRP